MTRLNLLIFIACALLFSCNDAQNRQGKITLTVKVTQIGQPTIGVSNVEVFLTAYPDSTQISYSGLTGQDGIVKFEISADSLYFFRADIQGQYCLPMYERSIIGPVSADTTICLTGEQSELVTFSGRILNCFGTPVTQATVTASHNSGAAYAMTNAQGDYSFQLRVCPDFTAYYLNLLVVDHQTAFQQLIQIPTFAISSSNTSNLGDLTVCSQASSCKQNPEPYLYLKTTTSEFCTTLPSSSIYWNDFHTVDTLVYSAYRIDNILIPNITPRARLSFSFKDPQNQAISTGSFPITDIQISSVESISGGYQCTATQCNLMVNLSKWEGAGGYAEGTLSGDIPPFGNPIFPFGTWFEVEFRAYIST